MFKLYQKTAKKAKLLLGLCSLFFLGGCNDSYRNNACQVDGDKALQFVEIQCGFGARYSGTAALKKTSDWLKQTAQELGYKVEVDVWQEKTILGNTTFRNLKAVLPGGKPGRIIVGTHYDLKYFKTIPRGFTGANDSASSTAVVLELMRVLKPVSHELSTIEFYFFDGEECFESYSETDGLFGSKRAAGKILQNGTVDEYKAMVLLDMIGDKDLQFTWSMDTNQKLVDYLMKAASCFDAGHQVKMHDGLILDDHIPFQNIGIPAIDLIDFDYGHENEHWHTGGDHIENVSADSMELAGNIAALIIGAVSLDD